MKQKTAAIDLNITWVRYKT